MLIAPLTTWWVILADHNVVRFRLTAPSAGLPVFCASDTAHACSFATCCSALETGRERRCVSERMTDPTFLYIHKSFTPLRSTCLWCTHTNVKQIQFSCLSTLSHPTIPPSTLPSSPLTGDQGVMFHMEQFLVLVHTLVLGGRVIWLHASSGRETAWPLHIHPQCDSRRC